MRANLEFLFVVLVLVGITSILSKICNRYLRIFYMNRIKIKSNLLYTFLLNVCFVSIFGIIYFATNKFKVYTYGDSTQFTQIGIAFSILAVYGIIFSIFQSNNSAVGQYWGVNLDSRYWKSVLLEEWAKEKIFVLSLFYFALYPIFLREVLKRCFDIIAKSPDNYVRVADGSWVVTMILIASTTVVTLSVGFENIRNPSSRSLKKSKVNSQQSVRIAVESWLKRAIRDDLVSNSGNRSFKNLVKETLDTISNLEERRFF